MWMLLLKPSVILGILLSLSIAANVTLFKMRDAALKHVGSVTAERDQAIEAGKICSLATENLKKASDDREKKLKVAVANAQKAAKVAASKAQVTLQMQPSQPNDLCTSSLDLSHQKLKERQEANKP